LKRKPIGAETNSTVSDHACPELSWSFTHRNKTMTFENQDRPENQASGTKQVAQAVSLAALMASAAAAPAAERAFSVVESVELATSPARAWAAINDFAAWQSWHPAFASTQVIQGDGHSKGTVRVLTTQDGAQFTEELVAFDSAARSYQYRIIESPAPVADYVSTIQVRETRAGSVIVWSSSFNVKDGASEVDAKKLISGVYRAGLDNLDSVLEK
jgi:hypothetical protein